MEGIGRRDFNKLLLASVPFAATVQAAPKYSKIAGIQFGVESFSFQDLPRGSPEIAMPKLVELVRSVGVDEVQPIAYQVEPFPMHDFYEHETLKAQIPAKREWRLSVPLSYYANIRKQFAAAGIRIWAYDIIPGASCTDEEIDKTFQAAKALGASALGGSLMLSEARRLVPFAEKHDMIVLLHNHDSTCNPDQFASPESYEAGLALSEKFMACLDLGHYAAGNNDTVEFLKRFGHRTAVCHVRDRQKNNGSYVRNGEGDARIADALRLIRDRQLPIHCYIEYEYGSFNSPVAEVLSSLEFCRRALES